MCIYITQQFSEVQPKSIRDNCSKQQVVHLIKFTVIWHVKSWKIKKSLKYYVREFGEINMLVYGEIYFTYIFLLLVSWTTFFVLFLRKKFMILSFQSMVL